MGRKIIIIMVAGLMAMFMVACVGEDFEYGNNPGEDSNDPQDADKFADTAPSDTEEFRAGGADTEEFSPQRMVPLAITRGSNI